MGADRCSGRVGRRQLLHRGLPTSGSALLGQPHPSLGPGHHDARGQLAARLGGRCRRIGLARGGRPTAWRSRRERRVPRRASLPTRPANSRTRAHRAARGVRRGAPRHRARGGSHVDGRTGHCPGAGRGRRMPQRQPETWSVSRGGRCWIASHDRPRPAQGRAATSTPSSSAPGSPACTCSTACAASACPRGSSKRAAASAAPGIGTAIPAPAATSRAWTTRTPSPTSSSRNGTGRSGMPPSPRS